MKNIKEERCQGRCLAGPVTKKSKVVKDVAAANKDCRVENLERNGQGKQNHNPGLQENRFWPTWESFWQDPIGMGLRTAGWSSRRSSSKKESSLFQCAEDQVSMAGDQHGCIRDSQLNSNTKRKCMEIGSTDGLPKKSTESLLQRVVLILGKPKLIWEMKPYREGKVTRKGFCRYSGSKRKAEEHMGLLLHGAGGRHSHKGQGKRKGHKLKHANFWLITTLEKDNHEGS